MKADINILLCFCRRFSLAVLWSICIAGSAQAAEGQQPEVNVFGWPVRDTEGRGINYSPEELAAKSNSVAPAINSVESNSRVAPQGFAPAEAGTSPFWQYAIFGSGIGLSNIIIGPAPVSGAREIILGGNSGNNFNDLFLPDNFWQVIRHNSTTGDYDHLFVSPIYSARVKRILTGNVLGDSREEIIVMLADGRIYFYDRATKTELGSINTGIGGLEGLSLADLDGDGFAELIVTTANDLFVFNGAGSLLWQVAGAGGYEVVVGQMDNDPALEIATTKGVVVDAATHTGEWGEWGSVIKS